MVRINIKNSNIMEDKNKKDILNLKKIGKKKCLLFKQKYNTHKLIQVWMAEERV